MTTHTAPVGTGSWQSGTIDGDPSSGVRIEPWDRPGLPTRIPGLAMQLQGQQDAADEKCEQIRHARAVLARARIEMSAEEAAAIAEDLDGYEQERLVAWLAGYDPVALRRYVAQVHRGRDGL